MVRLTNIDYDREIAIVAELNRDGERRIIGASRLTSEADRSSGEFAVWCTTSSRDAALARS